MILLRDTTALQVLFRHAWNPPSQDWVKDFYDGKGDILQAEEDKWKHGKDFDDSLRYVWVRSV